MVIPRRRSGEWIAAVVAATALVSISCCICSPVNEGGGMERMKRQNTDCDVRLANGLYPWYGMVEIFINGDWGQVCLDDWDLLDADVVCKQLGHSGALDSYGLLFPNLTVPVVISDVACVGDESALCECPSSTQTGSCSAKGAVAVCQTQVDPFDVRLVGGGVAWEGRVEVRVNNIWGTVCALTISRGDANVVCKELGYNQALYVFRTSTYYGEGTDPQWLDFVECTGSEESIFDCSNLGIGQAVCNHGNDLGVVCEGETTNETAPIRLVGGSSLYEGRLEVFYNGVWGTVCDTDWSLEDTHVACRQLGLGPASDQSLSGIMEGVGVVWLSEVSCVGGEGAVSECLHPGWAAVDCSHSQDVRMGCSALSNYPFGVRLVGNSSTSGRVEVLYGGLWGTVCDIGWDLADGNVVCRQLGYAGASATVGMATFGEGEGVVWMEGVGCNGSERYLADCPFPGWAENTCDHSQDAGVVCQAMVKSGAVRLVNGSSENEGRVEVFYSGTWGTICGNEWNYRDGDVVCRQLGYLRALRVTTDLSFGQGVGPTWLTGVDCSGGEEEIAQCTHSGWGVETCNQDNNAGVVCTNTPELSLRLVGGVSDAEGRVEILYNGTWGTICDNTWDLNDAGVVCSHLGFSGAMQAPRMAHFGAADDSTPIWLEEVHCTGQESNVDECNHDDYGLHTCIGGHDEDAGVICEVDTVIHPLRLVGGASSSEGRVEVFIQGEWGTVCDDMFSSVEGGVVCYQLGYTGILGVSSGQYSEGQGEIWLDNVFCEGDESYLTKCNNLGFGINNCQHTEDVGVVCDIHDPGEDGAIRLVGGDGQSNGRVEVFHEGQWGTVCDSGWDLADAEVVCKQLGFIGAHSGPRSALFGGGLGIIWLTSVQCTGAEERLDSCSHAGWRNTESCFHSNDASVVCQVPPPPNETDPSNYDVRLVAGTGVDVHSGFLQIYFNGLWGTVCLDQFTDKAARVVCRQLGYANGSVLAAVVYPSLDGVIWLDDVQCLSGEEGNLDECSHAPWGIHDCVSEHVLDVAVQCWNVTPTVIPTAVSPPSTSSTASPSSSPTVPPPPPLSPSPSPSSPSVGIVESSKKEDDDDVLLVTGLVLGVFIGLVVTVFVVTGIIVLIIHRKRRKARVFVTKTDNHKVSYVGGQETVNLSSVAATGTALPPPVANHDVVQTLEKPPLEQLHSSPVASAPQLCWEEQSSNFYSPSPTATSYPYNHSYPEGKLHTPIADIPEDRGTPSPPDVARVRGASVSPAHSSSSEGQRGGPLVARTMSLNSSSSSRERVVVPVRPVSVASSISGGECDPRLSRLGSVSSTLSEEQREEVEKELDQFVADFSKSQDPLIT